MIFSDKSIRQFAFICLLLALGTTALYWPITSHPFILYDDEQYVSANPHVTTGLSAANFVWAFKNSEAANWHPLTWISHQADCQLFGLNAGGHHLVNLLFHVANTLLVFVFLRSATGALWRSAFVAALFAWHPLHVESIAWASERKDTLSTFFWLLTMMAYVRFTELSKTQNPKSKFFCLSALILFALGLMSKQMLVTLPCVLLLLDFWPLQRISAFRFPPSDLFRRLLVEKIPFFAMTIVASAVIYFVQTDAGAVWKTPLIDRLANAVLAYARYVAKIFWPADLAIVYPHPGHWPVILTLGALVALAAWTFLCVHRWRQSPFLAVGWFWFLGTLVPTIGIVQVGAQSMADRYTYIPSIGFFIALVWGVAELCESRPERKRIFLLLGGGALAGCLLVTSIQISYWRDNVRLFRHAMEISPDNYVAANCLGKAYEKIGDHMTALVCYRTAVETEPRFPQSQYNLALCEFSVGQSAEGLTHLQAAASLTVRDPDIQLTLGTLFAQHGNWTNALNCFSNSVSVQPAAAVAHANYASALANLGQFTPAAVHFRTALRLKPDFADAQRQLSHLITEHPELK